MKDKDLAVYTVVMGGDFDLPPIPHSDRTHFICFSDQVELAEANGWEIRHVNAIIPTDTFRSSREMKIRPHRWLPEFERSIYIDSSVGLKSDPVLLWDFLIPDANVVFGAFYHSFRATLLEEFFAVQDSRRDYFRTVQEQLEAYSSMHPEILSERPVWGGVLARRHNEQTCIELMETWFCQVLRYSRRDQLSLPMTLSTVSADKLCVVQSDILSSEFHEWPVSSKPKPANYRVSGRMSFDHLFRLPVAKMKRKMQGFLG